MANFKPIETQEQFDELIKDRIARAESSAEKIAAEKYADYESLKEQVAGFDDVKADLETQLKEATEKLAGNGTEVEGLNAKIKQLETDSLKVKIAYELGLPLDMADRLRGETEEDIRKDASTMADYTKKGAPSPLRNPDADDQDGVLAHFRELNPNIKI